jgi:hypothetical protein
MDIALGIVGSFLPLLILGGIIFGIVRLVTRRDNATSESAGVMIRRFFQYSIMLAMLVLVTFGLAGVLDAAASTSSRITQDSERTALSIAFLVVGLPVFAGLSIYTSRRLTSDPMEQKSAGWAMYLTVALFGSLVTAMSVMGALLAILLDDKRVDRTLAIYVVIWVFVWGAHWWVARQKGDSGRLQAHLLLGSAAGLITTFTGIAAGLMVVLQQIYDRLFQVSIVDTGIEPLAGPLIVLAIGIPVLWWYWFRHGRFLDRGVLWLAYVLLLGVLGGAIALIIGTGVMVFGVLEWFLGDPSSSSAATHFGFFPGAIGSMIAGGASWLYHGTLVGERGKRKRTEVDRVYDYLLSGAGLVVAASGVATLITISLKAAAGLGITSFESGNATATALTLLVVGAPLWWRYWSTIQEYRKAIPEPELRSVTRRIHIFLLFGVAGIVAVVNLIIIVFIVFNDILEGDFGTVTLDGASVPIALLVTAGALAGYHMAVFRDDRAVTHDVVEPRLRRVVVVGSSDDPIVDIIKSDIGASVTVIDVVPDRTSTASVQDALETLRQAHHEGVVVVPNAEGGYEIMGVDE